MHTSMLQPSYSNPETNNGHPQIFTKLVTIYKENGFEVRCGLNPCHYRNYQYAPFAILFKDGHIVSTGGGIALQEIMFLEYLSTVYTPRNILVIGNAFGWSTLALSLLWPSSKLVAIDNCSEGLATDFINLTNETASQHGLNAKAIVGCSPNDVASIVNQHFDSQIDLVFIDGLHTNEQQIKDYNAVKQFCESGIIFFHDVLSWKMESSFREIADDWSGSALLLHRTPSGIGCLYSKELNDSDVSHMLAMFSDPLEATCKQYKSLRGSSSRLLARLIPPQVKVLLRQ